MRRGGRLALVCAALCAAAPLWAEGSASATAPAVTAWWSATNLGAVAAPPPSDVKKNDLFVQGSNAAPPGAVPGVAAPPSAQAIAALTFHYPVTGQVGSLRLRLDPGASAPPAAAVVACRVTKAFRAVQNGPYADVPPYDQAGCAPGQLSADGTSITFAKVAALARAGTLSVALIPGPLDRVVLAPPSATALAVSAAPGAGQPFGPPPPAGGFSTGGGSTGGGSTGGGSTGGGAAPTGGGSLGSVAAPGIPAAAPGSGPALAGPGAAAPNPAVAGPAPVAATASRPRAALGTRTARLLAGLGLVALLVFSLIGFGAGRPAVLAAAAGLGAQRPRTAALPAPERGVGRFRTIRDGRAPHLS